MANGAGDASLRDRNPALDPQTSMREAAIRDRFDRPGRLRSSPAQQQGRKDEDQRAHQDEDKQRPIVDGYQCALHLVDCGAHTRQELRERAVDGHEPGVSSSRRHLSTAAPPLDDAVSNARVAQANGKGSLSAAPQSADERPVQQHETPLKLRLVGGLHDREGRLEVLFNDTWGSVCSKGFGWTAAHVACRALGFGGVDGVSDAAEYGRSTGAIWLSHVDCAGTEVRLEHCAFYGLGRSTLPPVCTHEHDVGIACTTESMPAPQRSEADRHDMGGVSAPRHLRAGPEGGGEASCTAAASSGFVLADLPSALDMLEDLVIRLETARPLIDDAQLIRLNRLRLRIRRLAGKHPETVGEAITETGPKEQRSDGRVAHAQEADAHVKDLNLPEALAARLSNAMLDELRQLPRQHTSLAEAKAKFEERQRLESFDPLESDPVETALRSKSENYVPPILSGHGVSTDPKPHEILRKPTIQSLANRRPPSWQEAHQARVEYTQEQIRLGLAPAGIQRTLESGPWDHDPSFWGSTGGASDVVLDHELDEDR